MIDQELAKEHPELPIDLVAVNQTGLEAGLPEMPSDLPVLQDTADVNVWATWGGQWRDVVIVDRKGQKSAVYNLSEHDLGDPSNREALKALLVEASKR